MPEKLSIEIYRDIENLDIDPSIAVEGISLVNDVIETPLDIVDNSQTKLLTNPGAAFLRSPKVWWPASSADMRIVLTRKKLFFKDTENTIGFAHFDTNRGGGVAVISTSGLGAVDPHITVAHEIGHLFNMRPKVNSTHCGDSLCIMHRNLKTITSEKFIVPNQTQDPPEVQHEAARIVSQELGTETIQSRLNQRFCGSCTNELAYRSFFMLNYPDTEEAISMPK